MEDQSEPVIKQHGELQIEENLRAQSRLWVIQRWSYPIVALTLVLAALGLFGDGYLSGRELHFDGISVAFERIVQRDAAQLVQLRFSPLRGSLSLALDDADLPDYVIEHIVPEPAGMRASGGRTIFDFTSEAPSPERAQILFEIQARAIGFRSLHFSIVGGPSFVLRQFVFP